MKPLLFKTSKLINNIRKLPVITFLVYFVSISRNIVASISVRFLSFSKASNPFDSPDCFFLI